jgi:uncharacterized membrane protein
MRTLRGVAILGAMRDHLLRSHIVAGAIALASMIVPLVARKGGRVHRRAGWVFVVAMTGVSVTAFALAIWRFTMADAQHPNAHANGLFLFYVATLTAAGVSSGVRALRFKTRRAPHRNAWDLGIAAANVAMAVATLVYGLIEHRTLLVAFSFVGLITGGGQLRYWLRTPTTSRHWWFAHMGGMLGSCIAALTALVVVNASRFGTRTFATAATRGRATGISGTPQPTAAGWSAGLSGHASACDGRPTLPHVRTRESARQDVLSAVRTASGPRGRHHGGIASPSRGAFGHDGRGVVR